MPDLAKQFSGIMRKTVNKFKKEFTKEVSIGSQLIREDTPRVTGFLLTRWRVTSPQENQEAFIIKIFNDASYAEKVNEKYKAIEGLSPTDGRGGIDGFITRGKQYIENQALKRIDIELSRFTRSL